MLLEVFLHPGAKGEAVMIFDTKITSVSKVFVYASGGFDATEAFPSP